MKRTARKTGLLVLGSVLALTGRTALQAQQVTTIDLTHLPFPTGTVITNEFEAQGVLFSDDDSGMDPNFPCPSLQGQENAVNSGMLFNLYRLDFVTAAPVVDVIGNFTDNNLNPQIHGLYELDENRQIVQAVFFDDSNAQNEPFTLRLTDFNGIASIAACEQPLGAEGLVSITFTTLENRPPNCSAATATPATLWPPNGKLVPLSIRGVTDPDGDPITSTVTAVRQDEPLTKPGVPDATGIGTSGVSLRADRDGKGDGRIYRLSFEARDPLGASCTGTVTVCVPHDQGRGRTCGDGGGLFNSNGGAR